MSIQSTLRNLPQAFKDYCRESQQAGLAVIGKFKEFRNDPEFFQKVCQVAFASLQLIFSRYEHLSTSLARFAFTLQTANMHDFYGFLKQPRKYFLPVSADTIHEHTVLQALTLAMYKGVYKKEAKPEDAASPAFRMVKEIARSCLEAQLIEMAKFNDAYSSLEKLQEVLENRLHATKVKGFDFSKIKLEGFLDNPELVEKFFRHTPLVESITNWTWAAVDIGVIGLYLHGWKLLDTAKWAERIGQYPAFAWVKNQHLERWVLGLVAGAFALQVIEGTRKLRDVALTREQKIIERWNVMTSSAETILWGGTFLNLTGRLHIANSYLYGFAIFTKTLGLLSIAVRPKHVFFQKPEGIA